MLFKKFFTEESEKELKRLEPFVSRVNELEDEYKVYSNEDLKKKTAYFKELLASGTALDDILPEVFACVREASQRTLGERHYDVQLLGGMILHRSGIAEMKTGEGKTLVGTLATYLNALPGKGVHVVTVNDYLARRDAVWMGQIYAFLGLSVGIINSGGVSYLYDPAHKQESGEDKERDEKGSFKIVYDFLRPATRKEAYEADITYGTNNEFAFDYLRDNLAYKKEDVVGRGHYYAIIDEIDSILIDEARTPLIISAPTDTPEELYQSFAKVVTGLQKETDFEVDEKLKAVTLTDEGIEKAEKILGIENIYTEKGMKYVHHLENAIRAKALFKKDKEYVVRDDAIVIVDEFTGRLQPGRRWSQGLHQALEAKEGLTVQRESRTIASITFQNYFRLYKKLSGMTGTARTSEEEFRGVYELDVVPVPSHRPLARADANDLIFQTEKGKFTALARTVREFNEKGQPVLIGTASIEKNEMLSEYLTKEGIAHEVLNAKNHESEGETIAQAGRYGRVTVATNMAGRGVDIILGGSPLVKEEREKILELGGLVVLGTERHEARRIDNQLRGRAGRQGDPGFTQFFVSLEDSLMRVFASDAISKMMGRFGITEDQPIENKFITRALESAQTKIEGFHFDARKQVLSYDDVINQQRQSIYSLRGRVLFGEKEAVEEFLDEVRTLHPEAEKIFQKKREKFGEEGFLESVEKVILRAVDIHWMEHLDTMDYLRSSVNLRAYGQRDPLVEYKKEGLSLFRDMRNALYAHALEIISALQEPVSVTREEEEKPKNITLHSGEEARKESKKEPIKNEQSVGRNEPCPCGSGKKYKKCHGK
ncbi:MAG: preprotein translocase subunit SecA [Candidatus Paceibacterota bacterium]